MKGFYYMMSIPFKVPPSLPPSLSLSQQFIVEWLFTPGRNLCVPGESYSPRVIPTVRIHSGVTLAKVTMYREMMIINKMIPPPPPPARSFFLPPSPLQLIFYLSVFLGGRIHRSCATIFGGQSCSWCMRVYIYIYLPHKLYNKDYRSLFHPPFLLYLSLICVEQLSMLNSLSVHSSIITDAHIFFFLENYVMV